MDTQLKSKVKGTWVYLLGYAIGFDTEEQAQDFVLRVIKEDIR